MVLLSLPLFERSGMRGGGGGRGFNIELPDVCVLGLNIGDRIYFEGHLKDRQH